ncbi:MAG TPA: aldo/keto reductase [Candidatus Choladousia intestinigallinarum]|nr:aldo/keto reductase [Candidatus Choladousia intestinigallinarum]
MIYRKDRQGREISILGYGCMRFTKNGSSTDLSKAEKELMYAIEHGVNYLDTAYVYPGNEAEVGEILSRNHCREKIYLATKLPHYLIKSHAGIEKKFQEQLSRLKTDYIDYYLMHMLNDVKTWERLKKLGILEWIQEKKEKGQIRQIGFSFHGNTEHFIELLDAYDWDFCQIQYNYLDETSQAGRRGLEYAGEKGIPVIIMEPLRGGRLVNGLPSEALREIQNNKKFGSPARLALSWLWDQPQVTCVLSGMNSLEMVKENIETASQARSGCFAEEDFRLVERVRERIREKMKVGCTGCGYCMPCPSGVDIPTAFHCYNMLYAEKRSSGKKEYLRATAMRREPTSASQCIRCGRCEKHCPQAIPIRRMLAEASRELEPASYRLIRWAVHTFHIY